VNFKYKSLKEVNSALKRANIQAGIPLKKSFPELGESALYCVTEMHSKEDIDLLVSILKEALEG
jgi:glycine dehydrogenase subunit 1